MKTRVTIQQEGKRSSRPRNNTEVLVQLQPQSKDWKPATIYENTLATDHID